MWGLRGIDIAESSLAGTLALQLMDPVGPFFASATDPALAPPHVVGAGARCDLYGAVRACDAGLRCAPIADTGSGRCVVAR